MSESLNHTHVAVIGAGPGGYPAAFHAADLGLNVTLIDPEVNPGGVCLYRGCIPSKAMLHIAKIVNDAVESAEYGVTYGAPKIELDRVRAWKDRVVGKLTGGLGFLTKQRKIRHVRGKARFKSAGSLAIVRDDGSEEQLSFDHAIVATGSAPVVPGSLRIASRRVVDSTGALELPFIPKKMLVIGGGYIGCELGSVYSALGAEVTAVEALDTLVAAADRDLGAVLSKRMQKVFHQTLLKTKVVEMTEVDDRVRVRFEGLHVQQAVQDFDLVLVSVGRRPITEGLGLEHTRVQLDAKGFIKVDAQRRTSEPNLYAIGDVAGEPMLAHKASHEGRVAVDTIAGRPAAFEPRAIPAVVFTDPELAWCGLTETQARIEGITVKTVSFPWSASGRAATLNRNEGLTKLILDPQSEQVLGVGIAGVGAGEMIAEGVLAVEMGCRAEDLKMTIHAHPTLSETMMEAAEIFFGHATHFQSRR